MYGVAPNTGDKGAGKQQDSSTARQGINLSEPTGFKSWRSIQRETKDSQKESEGTLKKGSLDEIASIKSHHKSNISVFPKYIFIQEPNQDSDDRPQDTIQ